MPIQPFRPTITGELCAPLDCDEQALNALATVGAFVALADGQVEVIERDEAVDYIDRRRLARTISTQRIADFFNERVRHLRDRNFAELIVDALRPVPCLSLGSDVIRIAERVAAADGHVHPDEARMIKLIRLITMTFPDPKSVDPPLKVNRLIP